MNEDLLQYIWLAGLFHADNLKTTDGQEVMILKRGKINRDAGPDFSQARIRIGEADWVGNVEIHINSNDWFLHRHHEDKAYNNTVLHVVFNQQKPAVREDGTTVPSVVINDRIFPEVLKHYKVLRASTHWIPCEPFFQQTDDFTRSQALDRALVNRLERKTEQIQQWLKRSDNDWHSVFYIAVARSFGFGTNADPFEQLAMQLPLSVLGKHRNDAMQTEALVFGAAGFLRESVKDDAYYNTLQKEWQFLKRKYGLNELEESSFKRMRMRPGNFPAMRLAQLSALIYQSHHLLAMAIDLKDVSDIIALFDVSASPYWTSHYNFGKAARIHSAALSVQARELILINAVVPVLFIYGQTMGNENICTKALSVLQHLSPEKNAVTTRWQKLGLKAKNAFDTQAMMELKTQYCDRKQCLNCRVGNKILQAKAI